MPFIVMMGPQGSGKGTQAEFLASSLGIPHISVGTLFRQEIESDTDIGQQIASIIGKGEIVPLGVANRVLTDRLSKGDAAAGVILDGYPRTLEQAEMLDKIMAGLGLSLTHVIFLDVSDEEALRRIVGRRMCSNTSCERNYHVDLHPPKKPGMCDVCNSPLIQRKDDVPDAIRRRLEIYHKETAPLVDFYRRRSILVEVKGERPIKDVASFIAAAVGGKDAQAH